MAWSDDEVRHLVDAYLEMLALEQAGESYVKLRFNERVQELTGRTKGSVEFKFCNASAAIRDLGHDYIEGYKPRDNYQAALHDELERRLGPPVAIAAEAAPAPRLSEPPTGDVPAESSWAAAINRIPERGFGGRDVADAPGSHDDAFWPVGPSAPGADEAMEWFHAATAEGGHPCWMFLLGAPGNGKSHLSARLVEGFTEVNPRSDGLAHRSYRYEAAGEKELLLVNDATISRPGDEGHTAPLLQDLREAATRGDHVVANVNRGILFEERAGDPGPRDPVRQLVDWLHSGHGDHVAAVRQLDPSSDYLTLLELDVASDHPPVRVVVVRMDACSLFEPRPTVHLSTAGGEGPNLLSPYEITRLARRDETLASTTTAGPVLAAFVAQLPGSPEAPSDPIAANVASLRAVQSQSSMLTLLRCAEIATSRRFTYRELWGAVSLAVVGDLPQRVAGQTPVEWLEENTAARSREDKTGLQAYLDAAQLRAHVSLFGARPSPLSSWSRSVSGPVVDALSTIDPVRDARPGNGGHGEGWASPVLDAFVSRGTGESPLEALMDASGAGISHYVTSFDWELDKVFVRYREPQVLSDRESRALESWYGEYLLRLYAFAKGIPAFSQEVGAWTELWASAATGQAIEQDLMRRLRALLLPPHQPGQMNSHLVVPAFAARTEPITGRVERPTFVARMLPQWNLVPHIDGDDLFIELHDGADALVSLHMDFAMIRETFACEDGHPGITEHAASAAPRLERFRSSLLVTRPTAVGHAVADGTNLCDFKVG